MSHMRRWRRERGAAAVEMALVLPLLLLLLFGIIDFGRLLYTKVELSSAAREGARIVAINNPSPAGLQDDVEKRVKAAQSLSDVTVQTPLNTCPNAAGLATVNLETTFTWITPIGPLAHFFASGPQLGDQDLTVTAEGSMRCGL